MEGMVTISLACFNRLKVTRKELEDEYLAEHQQEKIDRLTYWHGLEQGREEGREEKEAELCGIKFTDVVLLAIIVSLLILIVIMGVQL